MENGTRFPWVGLSAVVAFALVAVLASLQVPESRSPAPSGERLPGLGLTRIDRSLSRELLAEQLAAYDPAPLFVPSEFSSNAPALPDEVRPEIGGPFAPVQPELTEPGALVLWPTPALPSSPVDGLRLTERQNTSMVLGRSDWSLGVLGARRARVEAAAAGSGQVVLTLDLPTLEGLPVEDWQPLELMSAVGRAGLVGELIVTTSSGSDEIDDYFRRQLRRVVRVGQRLPEGIYTIRVGP